MVSKSVAAAHSNLTTIMHHPQLPRVAAGVGALAVGLGLELVRRSLLARLSRSSRSTSNYLAAPAFETLRDIFSTQGDKSLNVPKGYEIHETAIYLKRVIRREI